MSGRSVSTNRNLSWHHTQHLSHIELTHIEDSSKPLRGSKHLCGQGLDTLHEPPVSPGPHCQPLPPRTCIGGHQPRFLPRAGEGTARNPGPVCRVKLCPQELALRLPLGWCEAHRSSVRRGVERAEASAGPRVPGNPSVCNPPPRQAPHTCGRVAERGRLGGTTTAHQES